MPGMRRVAVLTWIIAPAMIAGFPSASSAQVKVIISGGFSAAFRDLMPGFETASGMTVTTTTGGSIGTGPNTIGSRFVAACLPTL